MLPLVLSSDSHVFEPPDLWQTRIDAPFRDRAPRIERIDGADQIVVEADQILSGIGLISSTGARFEAPETISAQGRFEDDASGGHIAWLTFGVIGAADQPDNGTPMPIDRQSVAAIHSLLLGRWPAEDKNNVRSWQIKKM